MYITITENCLVLVSDLNKALLFSGKKSFLDVEIYLRGWGGRKNTGVLKSAFIFNSQLID